MKITGELRHNELVLSFIKIPALAIMSWYPDSNRLVRKSIIVFEGAAVGKRVEQLLKNRKIRKSIKEKLRQGTLTFELNF